MRKALAGETVEFFSRTRVTGVEREDDSYVVRTGRGTIRARHVVSATESYTPHLHGEFHDAILPLQEQAACGEGGPATMKLMLAVCPSGFA